MGLVTCNSSLRWQNWQRKLATENSLIMRDPDSVNKIEERLEIIADVTVNLHVSTRSHICKRAYVGTHYTSHHPTAHHTPQHSTPHTIAQHSTPHTT